MELLELEIQDFEQKMYLELGPYQAQIDELKSDFEGGLKDYLSVL